MYTFKVNVHSEKTSSSKLHSKGKPSKSAAYLWPKKVETNSSSMNAVAQGFEEVLLGIPLIIKPKRNKVTRKTD